MRYSKDALCFRFCLRKEASCVVSRRVTSPCVRPDQHGTFIFVVTVDPIPPRQPQHAPVAHAMIRGDVISVYCAIYEIVLVTFAVDYKQIRILIWPRRRVFRVPAVLFQLTVLLVTLTRTAIMRAVFPRPRSTAMTVPGALSPVVISMLVSAAVRFAIRLSACGCKFWLKTGEFWNRLRFLH